MVDDYSKLVAARYAADALAYRELWGPKLVPIAQRLLDRLPLAGARRVVDVGAGVGTLLPNVRAAAPDATIVALDLVPEMISLAPPDMPRAAMDAQALGFSRGVFDIGLMCFMLFLVPDPVAALRSVREVLRPGGTLGTITWAEPRSYPAIDIWTEELDARAAPQAPAISRHETMDTPEKVHGLLRRAGFEPVDGWVEAAPIDTDLEGFVRRVTSMGISRERLASLSPQDRADCVSRARERLAGLDADGFVEADDAVFAVARVPG